MVHVVLITVMNVTVMYVCETELAQKLFSISVTFFVRIKFAVDNFIPIPYSGKFRLVLKLKKLINLEIDYRAVLQAYIERHGRGPAAREYEIKGLFCGVFWPKILHQRTFPAIASCTLVEIDGPG